MDEALRYGCDVIAFEDLTDIRDRTGASWGHKWAFRTLYEQVEYKAEAVGVSVKQVGSAYTSRRCAECGFTQAYTPTCAYAEDYPCPLPPAENWLDVAVEAGEQTPH